MNERYRPPTPPREAASYIADLADELAGLATGPHMEVLRYLLEMARDEAKTIALAPEQTE